MLTLRLLAFPLNREVNHTALQDLSFNLINESIPLRGARLSVEIFTHDNVFTVKPGSYRKKGIAFASDSLLWGDSEKIPGFVSVEVSEASDTILRAETRLDEKKLRGMKFRFDGLPLGTLVNSIDGPHSIGRSGTLLQYPEGWRSPFTSLLVFDLHNGRYLYFEIRDTAVRPLRYYLREEDGKMRFDLVIDEVASQASSSFTSPQIQFGVVDDIGPIYQNHAQYLKSRYHLVPFSAREDVPAWFRKVALVVTLHMEGFTGHRFHTYETALQDVDRILSMIEGESVLFYLPGWEGRYYFDYGHYDAEPRMGGASALKRLVCRIHEWGSHVIGMYGINLASRNTPGFQDFGPESEFHLAGGGYFHNGSVDWDGAHHYDFDDLASLNIAKKPWQDHLFIEIANNIRDYDFDGAFLDIAALDTNDRDQEYLPGLFQFTKRLRSLKTDFLVGGEGSYDAMLMSMPLFQCGHTDGKMHYHDVPYSDFFTPFAREFAHLSLGDVAFHSTGVHELGHNPEVRTPLREGIIPTLALIDGTIEKAPAEVAKTIRQAKIYRRRYLK